MKVLDVACSWATVQFWRDRGILLWDISLLEPVDTKVGLKNTNCAGVMSDTVDEFCTRVFKVPELFWISQEKKGRRLSRPVFVAYNLFTTVATFCETSLRRLHVPRNHEITTHLLCKSLFADSASERKDYQINVARALQNIDLSEELNIDFGSEYSFL